jgi:hypothetical protein
MGDASGGSFISITNGVAGLIFCAIAAVLNSAATANASEMSLCRNYRPDDPRVPVDISNVVQRLHGSAGLQILKCSGSDNKMEYSVLVKVESYDGVCRYQAMGIPPSFGDRTNSPNPSTDSRPQFVEKEYMLRSNSCPRDINTYIPVHEVTVGAFYTITSFWARVVQTPDILVSAMSDTARKRATLTAAISALRSNLQRSRAGGHILSISYSSAKDSGIGQPCYAVWLKVGYSDVTQQGEDRTYELLVDVVGGHVTILGIGDMLP